MEHGQDLKIMLAYLVNEKGDLQGSDIKGPVSREAAERWPRIAATAKQIV